MPEEKRISPAVVIAGGLVLGLAAAVGIAALAWAAPPAPPPGEYCCPICEECFDSYDELYAHFTTAHPSEPITIIWE